MIIYLQSEVVFHWLFHCFWIHINYSLPFVFKIVLLLINKKSTFFKIFSYNRIKYRDKIINYSWRNTFKKCSGIITYINYIFDIKFQIQDLFFEVFWKRGRSSGNCPPLYAWVSDSYIAACTFSQTDLLVKVAYNFRLWESNTMTYIILTTNRS